MSEVKWEILEWNQDRKSEVWKKKNEGHGKQKGGHEKLEEKKQKKKKLRLMLQNIWNIIQKYNFLNNFKPDMSGSSGAAWDFTLPTFYVDKNAT